MKIILINGAPRSGKDTMAKNYYNKHSDTTIFERFSAPLKTAFAAMTNTPYNPFFELNYFEEHKEEIVPWLGVSYRQFQIDVSEKFMKPLYGKRVFGNLFLQRYERYIHTANSKKKVILVPDAGFQIENEVLGSTPLVDPNDVLLCRTHRPGYDFSNDSRSLVYTDKFMSIDIDNNGTEEDFQVGTESIINQFLNGKNSLLINGGRY